MKFLSLIMVLLLLPFSAFSGVNLKNGNFYISYTDIIVPGGGHDLEVTRTYNSKATEKGWFGFGWGSQFETFLTVAPDGTVVIHENGSGAMTRFTPDQAVDPEAAAQKIIQAMRKRTSLNEKTAGNIKKRLVNDAELRLAYSRRFGVSSDLAVGTKLNSNTRGIQTLEKVKDGFVRKYNDGKSERYNNEGQLVKIEDKNGYTIELEYENEKVASIKDSQAKQLFFEWYNDGKAKHIWSAGDKKTEYKYEGDNLTVSKDIAGNEFKYDYDSNHNMTEIAYSDDTKMEIDYTQKTQFVEEVAGRNGEVTKYDYGSNSKNPDMHYWTNVKKKTPSGRKISNKYEYEMKKRPDGSQYTYRIVTEVNGLKTETIYSECCSLPLKITRGDDVTTFEYNDKGLLTKKTSTRGEYVELKYHPKFNKITRVVNDKGWTNFKYDKRGNLSKAVNSDKKAVMLFYDREGRIDRMIDQDLKTKERRTLDFKYNSLGKPVEIAMNKVGKINVAYDNYGEIKKVESEAGHQMALKVTQAFQSLLAIVKPAGVNLNM